MAFDISPGRPAIISIVIHDIGVVNDGGTVVIIPSTRPISRDMAIINATGGNEYPKIQWDSQINLHIHTRAHRRPPVITATASPVNPGWSPFVSRYPGPSSVTSVYPTPIMEWCPSPIVIRHPSISILSHGPISIGAIRAKVLLYCWVPDVSIFWVLRPITIGVKFVVKYIE